MKTKAILTGLFISSSAFSLIHVDAKLGPSKFKTDLASKEVSGTQTFLELNLDPIPLVPVAFGLDVGVPTYSGKFDDAMENTAKLTGMQIGLHVKVWTPVGFMGITPYAQLGYVVYGNYKMDTKIAVTDSTTTPATVKDLDASFLLKTSGSNMGVGIRYSLLPLIGLMLEYNMRNEKIKLETFKLDSVKADFDGFFKTAKVSEVLIGLEVGI